MQCFSFTKIYAFKLIALVVGANKVRHCHCHAYMRFAATTRKSALLSMY